MKNSNLTKSTLTTGDLISIAACAALIGVSRQHLNENARQPGFPIHVVNGKRRVHVSDVLAWREVNIHFRRRRDEPTPPQQAEPEPADAEADEIVDSPGVYIRDQDLFGKPFDAKRWVGAGRWEQMTIADLEELAKKMTCGLEYAMCEICVARGDGGILRRAPRSYYNSLFAQVAPESLRDIWEVVMDDWIGKRWPELGNGQ
jgi:hypothetical protein